jgi:transcriptional regulator with XRE-family HTH domain
MMMIGQRLRKIREEKGLSHGDVQHASGLLRCYISRVEHEHTVPSLETLERFADALDVPLYRLFLAGDGLSATPHLTPRRSLEELADEAGASGSEARLLLKLRECIGRMSEPDRAFLLDFAHKLATPEGGPTTSGDVTACQHQSL